MISSAMTKLFAAAFVRKIAMRDSGSGGVMETVIPAEKRDFRRSSRFWMRFGCWSDEKTICLLLSYNVLNRWNNSSCVFSFFERNWISSIIKRSYWRYLSLNEFTLF